MPKDPITDRLRAELGRREKERADLASNVVAFRKRHKITDEQCAAMIRALGEGKAQTLEEAFTLTSPKGSAGGRAPRGGKPGRGRGSR
jgi:hypothetical protein